MTTAPAKDGLDFAYGYGRVGVLQQNLLHKQDIDRLISAHTDKELHQILGEISFTSSVMPMDNLDFVPAMERWLKDQMFRLAPEGKAGVFDILWLREDQAVIAHLLKEYHEQTSGLTQIQQSSVTAYDIDMLRKQVMESGHRELPEDIAHFIESIKAKKNIRPEEIDHETAVFIANKQLELAKASGSPLIIRYVRHLIDLQNIRTARRIKPGEDTAHLFIAGGEIDPRRITTNPREIALLIHNSTLPQTLADSMTDSDDTALVLERSLNRGLAHDVAEMRSVPLSLEPIFAYGVMALSQILMIRTILIGKAAHLEAADIARMLPPIFSTSIQNA
jgi:PIN domain nuclease of toxin-antitoxin system